MTNPTRTAAEICKAARAAAGLSQAEFASTFHVALGRVRDVEQSRFAPDSALVAYLLVIGADPGRVREILAGAPARAATLGSTSKMIAEMAAADKRALKGGQ